MERTKQGYKLHKDGEHFDESRAVGLLKELAEKEEQKLTPQESPPVLTAKALGEGAGSSGGYLVNSQQVERLPAEAKGVDSSPPANPYLLAEGVDLAARKDHNEEVTDLLKRRGLILGKNMLLGSGTRREASISKQLDSVLFGRNGGMNGKH